MQEKQVLEQTHQKKLISAFTDMVKNQAAFFAMAKRIDEPRFHAIAKRDEKLSFFNECLKAHVSCFPLLNKVHNHTLLIKDKILNDGVCFAMRAVLKLMPHLVYHLYLDTNNLNGPKLKVILEGVVKQMYLKSLTIQDNEINSDNVE